MKSDFLDLNHDPMANPRITLVVLQVSLPYFLLSRPPRPLGGLCCDITDIWFSRDMIRISFSWRNGLRISWVAPAQHSDDNKTGLVPRVTVCPHTYPIASQK